MKSRFKGTIRGWFALAALVFLGSFVPAAQPSSAQVAPAAFGLPWMPPATAYRIAVTLDGLYALTYTDLSNAGLPVTTLDPRSFQVFYMGQEVPIQVIGEDDGAFGTADLVLFYARGVDSLYLDGVLPTNKYTATNIYWLTYGAVSQGARMATVDGSGAGSTPAPFVQRLHLQQSKWYFAALPFEHDADHWYADWISEDPLTFRSFTFTEYNHPAAELALPGSLTLRLLGWALDTPHHLQVWVNNNLLIDGTPGWQDDDFYMTTVEVPRSYFVQGVNTIKLGLALETGFSSDMVYLDWWDLQYYDTHAAEGTTSGNSANFNNANAGTWRYNVTKFASAAVEVYDVTDPFAPQRFVNTTVTQAGATYTVSFGDMATGTKRYLALTSLARRKPTSITKVTYAAHPLTPTDLRSTANRADYILITHSAFWNQAVTLAEYRDRDFDVALVDVQQIYDQFNGGLMSAESIRDFLAYAHSNWTGSGAPGTPAPAYVLLMGDGTNDMRKYRTTYNTYIPPYLYLADPSMGETAADNRFVTFIGDDNIPDMHIGRFPVNNVTQAQAMVDKTMRYEVSCQCDGVWDKNALFVADDLDGGGGDFRHYSDLIADGYADEANTVKLIPDSYTRQKEYLGSTCDINPSVQDAAECRGNLVDTLNTTGSLFVSYVGHATKDIWAPEEHIFDVQTNRTLLTNGPCLPIMLAMTCYEGSFHDFETPETLAESSVRLSLPDDPATPENEYRTPGAVASFSPTGFGLVTGHDYLEKGMMLAWFHEGIDRLGASATFAKQYLVDNAPVGKYLDLLDTFLLLGDPALQVKTADACLAPTAVMMDHFSARGERGGVRVTWQTADESDLLGFNVLRRALPTGASAGEAVEDFTTVNGEIILAQQMGVAAGASYAYLDRDVRPGRTYQYLLEIVKLDGSHEFYGPAESGMIDLRLPAPHVDPGNQ